MLACHRSALSGRPCTMLLADRVQLDGLLSGARQVQRVFTGRSWRWEGQGLATPSSCLLQAYGRSSIVVIVSMWLENLAWLLWLPVVRLLPSGLRRCWRCIAQVMWRPRFNLPLLSQDRCLCAQTIHCRHGYRPGATSKHRGWSFLSALLSCYCSIFIHHHQLGQGRCWCVTRSTTFFEGHSRQHCQWPCPLCQLPPWHCC